MNQVRSMSRVSSINTKPAEPVSLSFGRPDIGAYLTDTFTMQKETPLSMDESGLDKSSAVVDVRDTPRNISHKTMCSSVGRSATTVRPKNILFLARITGMLVSRDFIPWIACSRVATCYYLYVVLVSHLLTPTNGEQLTGPVSASGTKFLWR